MHHHLTPSPTSIQRQSQPQPQSVINRNFNLNLHQPQSAPQALRTSTSKNFSTSTTASTSHYLDLNLRLHRPTPRQQHSQRFIHLPTPTHPYFNLQPNSNRSVPYFHQSPQFPTLLSTSIHHQLHMLYNLQSAASTIIFIHPPAPLTT